MTVDRNLAMELVRVTEVISLIQGRERLGNIFADSYMLQHHVVYQDLSEADTAMVLC